MEKFLKRLFEEETLSKKESKEIIHEIASGKHNHAHIASFLTVYLMRSITVDELSGFRDALLDLALQIDLSDFNTVDLCGTGGDSKNTFNISTAASFVTAGSGQKVAKHGNYGVSSVSGSSNMLEHFGYSFTNNESALKRQIDKANICFLHAPLFHPAMKTVAPVRKELRMKTFFNLLGPLVNPAQPHSQLTGVYSYFVLDLYSDLFKQTNIKHSIVHSVDGYDEISLTSAAEVIQNNKYKVYNPEDLGLKQYKAQDLFGGNKVADSADIFISVLEGKGSEAQTNVVLVNAAFALMTAQDISFENAFEKAKESLFGGNALKSFKTLIELSRHEYSGSHS